MGREESVSGHLGIKKTYNKIRKSYFWPGMKGDVKKHCRTCHTCQKFGKPNQVIPKAQLKPVPLVEEPFSRLIIDCVGPLPKTASGKEYLLTIMCSTTRYPEAVSLRNIKAKPICDAVSDLFGRFGFPKEIQSDLGSNFTSNMFGEFLETLGIRHVTSTAYHPESQGVLERFHQTLKSMLKKYCYENSKNWDQGVELVLFALRDMVQKSSNCN